MTAAAHARETSLRNAFEACAWVDDLGADATGEIVVRGVDLTIGSVFVEGGRVCWAAARGLARRLTELLEARAGLAPRSMEPLFVECREQRIPLGEHLVARGVLSAESLRDALLQHTAESLLMLCRADARASWMPRSGKGYSPRFTFATGELLAHVGALRHDSLAARVSTVLRGCFDDDSWAVAYARAGASAFPEPIASHGKIAKNATALVRFGKWATSVLDVTGAFTDEDAMFAVTRASPSSPASVIAFRECGAVFAGETGTYGFARILNRRARQRRIQESPDADL